MAAAEAPEKKGEVKGEGGSSKFPPAWLRDGAVGFGTGILFGTTSVITSYPFDSLKTRMQAGAGFERGGTLAALRLSLADSGVLGLYRGMFPMLLGSGVFRSVQFAAYEAAHSALGAAGVGTTPVRDLISFSARRREDTAGESDGPADAPQPVSLLDTEPRVWAAATAGGFARAVFENPLECIKVRGQLGLPWAWRDLTRGFLLTAARSSGALAVFFTLVGTVRRAAEDGRLPLFAAPSSPGPASESGTGQDQVADGAGGERSEARRRPSGGGATSAGSLGPVGTFVTGALCATAGWYVVWPLEVAKSVVQGPGAPGLWSALRLTVRERGILGIYRGIGPGTARSLVANGSAFLVMSWANEWADKLGLRG